MSWIVPFFSFIMIAALGVDYNIFLMMRYNELEGMLDQELSGIALYGWRSIVYCLYGATSKNVVDKSSYI
ncbi:hypothetical protein BSK52_24715 [Paenibacillus odorifer]|uniref:Membrane transport protein MMPL domain-containing protein n=1 Tax=Paenibacillus odorifer TaxID=189426 RepID=A0A1R0XMK1_9BACL|nr:MMPL family transporter [Paenibacillus odorifer]OMD36298.1 hypothetical protein BSK52_24715 [Paenibacillus odorifer]